MLASLLIIVAVNYPTHGSWQEAQAQMARRYPQYRGRIYATRPPTVGWRVGVFYDENVGKDVYGSCVLGRVPEVLVGIVSDPPINRDTTIHEYKHAIAFRLPLSDSELAKATSWIDKHRIVIKSQRRRLTTATSRAASSRRALRRALHTESW